MIRQFAVLASLLIATTLHAELPDPKVDPLKLDAYFASTQIKTRLSYADHWCRDDYYSCGPQSWFVWEDQNGVTADGNIASLWIGRWFSEPMSQPLFLRTWAEVVYVEFWVGTAPFVDYSAASMAIQGINWWNFVGQLMESVSNNKKGTFELSAPGWYGVHLSDNEPNILHTAVPANIILTANVTRVSGAFAGDVELSVSIDAK